MRLRFSSFEGLVKWLTTTKFGQDAIREAIYSPAGQKLLAELLEREQTTHVLVKAWGDGMVEVFAERHVRVKVVGMPATDDPKEEVLAEEWLDVSLKPCFAGVNYPSWKRGGEYVPPYWSFREFVESAWWRENGPLLLDEIKRFRELIRQEQTR